MGRLSPNVVQVRGNLAELIWAEVRPTVGRFGQLGSTVVTIWTNFGPPRLGPTWPILVDFGLTLRSWGNFSSSCLGMCSATFGQLRRSVWGSVRKRVASNVSAAFAQLNYLCHRLCRDAVTSPGVMLFLGATVNGGMLILSSDPRLVVHARLVALHASTRDVTSRRERAGTGSEARELPVSASNHATPEMRPRRKTDKGVYPADGCAEASAEPRQARWT